MMKEKMTDMEDRQMLSKLQTVHVLRKTAKLN